MNCQKVHIRSYSHGPTKMIKVLYKKMNCLFVRACFLEGVEAFPSLVAKATRPLIAVSPHPVAEKGTAVKMLWRL
jgi:hypothetical protein